MLVRIASALVAVLGLVGSACGGIDADPVAPGVVRLTGTWSGSNITFFLSETYEGGISGWGRLGDVPDGIDVSVLSGNHTEASVSFSYRGVIWTDALVDGQFYGVLSGNDAIRGVVYSPCCGNFMLTLRRQ